MVVDWAGFGDYAKRASSAGLACRVKGADLYYDVEGVGPAMVLVHGFTLDGRMWDEQVAALIVTSRPSFASTFAVLGGQAIPPPGLRTRTAPTCSRSSIT